MKTLPPLNLEALADQFDISLHPTCFPLNSMPLFYLMMVRDLTDGDEESLHMIHKAVPRISKLVRWSGHLAESSSHYPDIIHTRVEQQCAYLYEVIDTPQIRFDVEKIWLAELCLYRHQRLESFAHDPTQEIPETGLLRLLQLYAINHFLYAQAISSILSLYEQRRTTRNRPQDFHPRQNIPSVIRQCVSIVFQINDLVDALCDVESDTEEDKTSPLISIAQQHTLDSQDTGRLIRLIPASLQQQLTRLPLSPICHRNVQIYAAHLVDILNGRLTAARDA